MNPEATPAIPGQMTVDECIRIAEIAELAATSDPVGGCVYGPGQCQCWADCEIAGTCLEREE